MRTLFSAALLLALSSGCFDFGALSSQLDEGVPAPDDLGAPDLRVAKDARPDNAGVDLSPADSAISPLPDLGHSPDFAAPPTDFAMPPVSDLIVISPRD